MQKFKSKIYKTMLNANYKGISSYHQTSNISHTLIGNKIFGSLQQHLHSRLNTWLQYIAQIQLQDEMWNIQVLEFGAPYIRDFRLIITAPTIYKAMLHMYKENWILWLKNQLNNYKINNSCTGIIHMEHVQSFTWNSKSEKFYLSFENVSNIFLQ